MKYWTKVEEDPFNNNLDNFLMNYPEKDALEKHKSEDKRDVLNDFSKFLTYNPYILEYNLK